MSQLKILSWNIRGIGSLTKRNKILNHITHLQPDICLLQETHLSKTDTDKLITPQFNKVYSSNYNSRQRGVSILINRKIKFTHNTTITDPEGRFIIINIILNNNQLTIGNIYGPNTDNPSFFQNFFATLSENTNNTVIIGGDFNTVINHSLDRSNNSTTNRTTKSTNIITQYANELGLGDSWRLQNPSSREYTFYSTVHKTYSRIDFFLISNSIISNISDSTIHPIIISDHAPISITWKPPNNHQPSRRWRFNTSLLKDPEFNNIIKKEWTSFLEINDSPETSPSLLWQTGKAVLRGVIISYSTYKKKKEQHKQLELE